jgi:hypothetical protein
MPDKYYNTKNMRDLLNTLDNLTESVGLANRRPGDRWANPQGDEIIFHSLDFYPPRGSFEDEAQMQSEIEQVSQAIGVPSEKIFWTNQPRGARAFAIAHFVDDKNQDYYLARYFREISPIRSKNEFPNTLPGEFKLQTKAAKKEAAGYKPTDVLTNLRDLTPEDILAQIRQKFGADSSEAQATEIFLAARSYPIVIPRGTMNFEAFTNYFCEMLQPIALVQGKPTVGNAPQAEQKFMTQGGYQTCLITFGSSQIGGLTDSSLINPAGQIMGLSSKAEQGAKASARNLMDKVKEMEADEDGRKLLTKYDQELSMLRTVTEGSTPGSLNMAIIAGIISAEEKDQVLALQKMGAGEDPIEQGMLSDRLKKMYQDRKARDPSQIIPFYHLRAAIANKVADWVNKETNFGRAASEILNWGAFIQVYTYADLKGDDIVMKPFRVVWPSNAVTDVLLSADKTFYSTGSKGNFTFKILYNGASDAETDVVDDPVDTKPDVDLDQVTQQRSSVKAFRKSDSGDEKTLGRKRRQ